MKACAHLEEAADSAALRLIATQLADLKTKVTPNGSAPEGRKRTCTTDI